MSDLGNCQGCDQWKHLKEKDEVLLCAPCRDEATAANLRDTIKDLERRLAECYHLSGADPDGAPDSMLAESAVQEVRRLREESDQSDHESILAQAYAAQAATRIAELEKERAALHVSAQELAELKWGFLSLWHLATGESSLGNTLDLMRPLADLIIAENRIRARDQIGT